MQTFRRVTPRLAFIRQSALTPDSRTAATAVVTAMLRLKVLRVTKQHAYAGESAMEKIVLHSRGAARRPSIVARSIVM